MQARFEGIDDRKVIEAMGSTSRATFIIWEKPGAGNGVSKQVVGRTLIGARPKSRHQCRRVFDPAWMRIRKLTLAYLAVP